MNSWDEDCPGANAASRSAPCPRLGRMSPRRAPKGIASMATPQRILIADDNPIMRETLAQWLRAQAHDVITASRGESALAALRDWSRPVGWLYTRAVLPGLVDGWILADQYHDLHENRPVILAGAEQRISSRGDRVLMRPTPAAIFNALRLVLTAAETTSVTPNGAEASRAA
ncbi:response regulator [Microvirga lotononidis]|uniref:Response regulator with CheY-like receiver, AAA-type ATPase, and DNA-binding domains n=1 Tax=Microvirga lotononidis TaxID=864069 RepID=I4YZP7_9HYPH|nr:response regulator [Microvirga lotononidis]EIM29439.1 response regulator with CheY-like receiver, AAA-type ATPase, and DNA-binding domains [Microvirga lotononidis]WQO27241.1 response regulator [Microvirga lotononidis]